MYPYRIAEPLAASVFSACLQGAVKMDWDRPDSFKVLGEHLFLLFPFPSSPDTALSQEPRREWGWGVLQTSGPLTLNWRRCVLHFHLLRGQEGGLMLTHLGLAEDALWASSSYASGRSSEAFNYCLRVDARLMWWFERCIFQLHLTKRFIVK